METTYTTFAAEDLADAEDRVIEQHPQARALVEASSCMGRGNAQGAVWLDETAGTVLILLAEDDDTWGLDVIAAEDLRALDVIAIGLEEHDDDGELLAEVAEADIAGQRRHFITELAEARIADVTVESMIDTHYRSRIEHHRHQMEVSARLRAAHVASVVAEQRQWLCHHDRSEASAISRAAEKLGVTAQTVRNIVTKTK